MNCYISLSAIIARKKGSMYPFSRPRPPPINPFYHSALGIITSRATSGGRRNDRNTNGQWGNNVNTSYRDINCKNGENGVVKPKFRQETSLNKMLSNFSKVLIAQISFTAVINNGGIGKGIGGIRKGIKKNHIYVL